MSKKKEPKPRNPFMMLLVKESTPGGSHRRKDKILVRKAKHKKKIEE